MIDREEQFDLQAMEHARLRALYDAEADRIAEESIDKILAERERWELEYSARESEALERNLEIIAARIEERGEIEISTLAAIRRAVVFRRIRGDVALTLAYRLGLVRAPGYAGGLETAPLATRYTNGERER